jgi:SNF2 family DNA or RNA helicase
MRVSRDAENLAHRAFETLRRGGTRLFKYQRSGIMYMVDKELRCERGGMLADAPGLGKTMQLIGLMLARPGTTLFVCPPSIVQQVVDEIARVATAEQLAPFTSFAAFDQSRTPNRVLVTSIGKFARRHAPPDIIAHHWTRIIIDEAHVLRTPSTLTYGNIRSVDADHVWLSTGTCMCNGLRDFAALCDLVGRTFAPRDKLAARQAFDRVVLRRSYDDAVKHNPLLPDRETPAVEIVPVTMHEREARIYAEFEDRIRTILATGGKGCALRLLTKLRQMAISPRLVLQDDSLPNTKLDHVADRIRGIVGEGNKCIVFYAFTAEMKSIAAAIPEAIVLDGGLDAQARADAIRRFNRCDGGAALIIQIKAGSEGINLQEASRVIFTGPHYNPVAVLQAIARAHRTGSKHAVRVHMFVSRGTIEERVNDVCADKAALLADLMKDKGVRRVFDHRVMRS